VTSIVVLIAVVLALLAGLGGFITGVTLSSWMPVQAFWVNGALALWIASPRRPAAA
jgi:hypothetical protein